jgi:hypothetical protein
MLDSNARNFRKTQLFSGLDANRAIEDGIAAPDQDRITKAERGDRGCDFTNVSRLLASYIARRADEIGGGDLFDRQRRQKIVAPPQGRSGCQGRKTRAATFALSLQIPSECWRLVGDPIRREPFRPPSFRSADELSFTGGKLFDS